MDPSAPIWKHALSVKLTLHMQYFPGIWTLRPFQSLVLVPRTSAEVTDSDFDNTSVLKHLLG